MRWFHSLAAVVWVGGSLFYVLVVRPYQRRSGAQGPLLEPGAMVQFRGLVDTCIAVLLVTGTVLLFDRLSDATTGVTYLATVGVKIGLALWMFAIARGRWQRARSAGATQALPTAVRHRILARVVPVISGVNMTVILGVAVFFLSDLLRFLFEEGLTGG
ncbi:MAG: hypothetical protein HYX93_05260 [Chloroflexi bacterium]|nr:hypothetical protein [Chloroflexota bacterium]